MPHGMWRPTSGAPFFWHPRAAFLLPGRAALAVMDLRDLRRHGAVPADPAVAGVVAQ